MAGYSAVTPGFHINVMIVVITPENVERCLWPPVSMRLSCLLQNKKMPKRAWVKVKCTAHFDICFVITMDIFSGKWFLYDHNDRYDLHC